MDCLDNILEGKKNVYRRLLEELLTYLLERTHWVIN